MKVYFTIKIYIAYEFQFIITYSNFFLFRGRKSTHQLAFSLNLDAGEMAPFYFVAPDEMVYDYWVDGINALLGKYI